MLSNMTSGSPVLEPLSLTKGPEAGATSLSVTPDLTDHCRVTCLFCESTYSIQKDHNDILKHFIVTHKFVIGDVNLVADFKSYLDYWRPRLKEKPITEFCTVIKTNSKPTDTAPSEFYYLLCDALPEDKTLRTQLQQNKLKVILDQQQMERDDQSFSRCCLFCREQFTTNRAALFDHMVQEHNFSVGRSDNLVYTNELLDVLEQKLNSLQCLYCEKTFKDRHVLKEHMRKKLHKKINPQNSTYDKFYVINYLETGKKWEELQGETDRYDTAVDAGNDSDAAGPDDEWSDWTEDRGAGVVCLYCKITVASVSKILQHMKDVHQFDLELVRREQKLSFYQQIKLVNYIRRQVHQHTCPVCQTRADSSDALVCHMQKSGHTAQVPDTTAWDQSEYFFSTYEDDALLFGLQDDDPDVSRGPVGSSEADVIAEDCPDVVTDSVLNEIREQLIT